MTPPRTPPSSAAAHTGACETEKAQRHRQHHQVNTYSAPAPAAAAAASSNLMQSSSSGGFCYYLTDDRAEHPLYEPYPLYLRREIVPKGWLGCVGCLGGPEIVTLIVVYLLLKRTSQKKCRARTGGNCGAYCTGIRFVHLHCFLSHVTYHSHTLNRFPVTF